MKARQVVACKGREMKKAGLAVAGLLAATSVGIVAIGAPVAVPANAGKVARASYVWRNVEIVGGGFVPGMVFSPREAGLIYARTDIGGAYRWNTKTKRWIPITDIFGPSQWNFLGIESIAPDPTDANRVYMAVGTYTNDWAGNGAILRSSDRGNTWQRTDMPFKIGGNESGRSMGERLAVDPNDPNILYFGSRHNGLWKSLDRGATWSKTGFPWTDDAKRTGIGWVMFDARSGARGRATPTIYAGTDTAGATLFQSRDGGATWQAVAGQPALVPHHAALDASGVLYISYSNGPGPNGVSDGAV